MENLVFIALRYSKNRYLVRLILFAILIWQQKALFALKKLFVPFALGRQIIRNVGLWQIIKILKQET